MSLLLSQLIGAKDALLVLINDRLGLGIEIEEIELNAINKKLTLRNKCDILEELNKLTSNPRNGFGY